jgi:hypothetical protein
MELSDELTDYLIDRDHNQELEKDAGRTDVIQTGIMTQTYVLEKGADYWILLRDWNESNRKLTSKEVGVLEVACSIPRKIPTENQCHVLVAAEKRATSEGFFPG